MCWFLRRRGTAGIFSRSRPGDQPNTTVQAQGEVHLSTRAKCRVSSVLLGEPVRRSLMMARAGEPDVMKFVEGFTLCQLVPRAGIEPAWLAPQDFKSCVSTCSTTEAAHREG